MSKSNPRKQDMYDWIETVKGQLDTIREHVDPLPDSAEDEWDNQHWAHVAHIAYSCGSIASSTAYLHEEILGILSEKIRIDAKLN